MNIYYNGTTAAGADAWTQSETTTVNQPYAWVAQVLAGYSPSEVRSFARAAFDENVFASIGATQTVGGVALAGYIRVYDEMRELIGTLQENGFDVWILTASPQFVVDGISEEVGVAPERVIGIRSVLVDGKLTYDLQGCGTVADGDNTLITYYDGKRCWINKVIFGEPAASQLAVNPDSAKRAVFVAGDSVTDVSMLQDATYLKLAIDRNKTELMCNAYANYTESWLVQPMFISPKTVPASYACSTTVDPSGALIVDEAGDPIPDQVPMSSP
jgi:phosphoglycolate phosphatase-like HAD superfamily hydrolase